MMKDGKMNSDLSVSLKMRQIDKSNHFLFVFSTSLKYYRMEAPKAPNRQVQAA